MKPGFHVETVTTDLEDAPSNRAARECRSHWEGRDDLRSETLVALTPVTPRHLWVSLLRARTTGQGLGKAVMDAVCAACDEHGVVIELKAHAIQGPTATPFGGLDQTSLTEFYERRGFVMVPNRRDGRMIREPSAAHNRPGPPCADQGDRATLSP